MNTFFLMRLKEKRTQKKSVQMREIGSLFEVQFCEVEAACSSKILEQSFCKI